MSKAGIFAIAFGVFAGLFFSGGGAPADPEIQVVTTAEGVREIRIPRSGDGHYYAHAMVNGQLVRFLIDTGATDIALTMEDARRVGENFSAKNFEIVGTGASGPVRGQELQIESIELGGREVTNLRGAVIEGLGVSLLGQSFLTRTGGVRMTADQMIIH